MRYLLAWLVMMKPTCLAASGNSSPCVVGALTRYIRSLGATRAPVVLYQERLFHPNVLSTATKKPFPLRFAIVASLSDSRSASLIWIFSFGSWSYQGRGGSSLAAGEGRIPGACGGPPVGRL